MPNRILVTGFGPFSKTSDNPSAILAAESGEDHRILEVAWQTVDDWIGSGDANDYNVLLHLGFADRHFMTPELFARNFIGHTPDVRGEVRAGDIELDGPLLLDSTLWTPELLGDLLMDDRLRPSEDAGNYLCNYIVYRSLMAYPDKMVGFLHVPNFDRISEADQQEVIKGLLSSLRS